jgi:hypothetical protein
MSPIVGLQSRIKEEEGSIQVHPINHLIAKMSFLLTCIYRARLEAMGLSIEVIDFSTEVKDP